MSMDGGQSLDTGENDKKRKLNEDLSSSDLVGAVKSPEKKPKTSPIPHSVPIVGPITYIPNNELPDLNFCRGCILEVHVDSKFLKPTQDGEHLPIWGTHTYSVNSDVISIMKHRSLEIDPKAVGFKVYLEIEDCQKDFVGSTANGITSQSGPCEPVCLKLLGSMPLDPQTLAVPPLPDPLQDLSSIPLATSIPFEASTLPPLTATITHMTTKIEEPMQIEDNIIQNQPKELTPYNADNNSFTLNNTVTEKQNPNLEMRIEEVKPYPIPDNQTATNPKTSNDEISVEKATQQLRPVSMLPTSFLVFNLSNEVALKYDLSLVCDSGIEHEDWTTFKLKKDVLYLETQSQRYELAATGDTYRWALVQNPFLVDRELMLSLDVPLSQDYVNVLHSDLSWNEIAWGHDFVIIKDKEYKLTRLFWVQRSI